MNVMNLIKRSIRFQIPLRYLLPYKVLLCGEKGAGKTTFSHKLAGKAASDTYQATPVGDFIKSRVKENKIWDQIWECGTRVIDTAGQGYDVIDRKKLFQEAKSADCILYFLNLESLKDDNKHKRCLRAMKAMIKGFENVMSKEDIKEKLIIVGTHADKIPNFELATQQWEEEETLKDLLTYAHKNRIEFGSFEATNGNKFFDALKKQIEEIKK